MNYWIINGIGIKAVDITTALHKYGQYYKTKMGKPSVGSHDGINWKRVSHDTYKKCQTVYPATYQR